jgi:hypothetical protein
MNDSNAIDPLVCEKVDQLLARGARFRTARIGPNWFEATCIMPPAFGGPRLHATTGDSSRDAIASLVYTLTGYDYFRRLRKVGA